MGSNKLFKRWLFWFTLIAFVAGIVFRRLDYFNISWIQQMSEVFWVYFDIAFVLAFAILAGLIYQQANTKEDNTRERLDDIDKRVKKMEKLLSQSRIKEKMGEDR